MYEKVLVNTQSVMNCMRAKIINICVICSGPDSFIQTGSWQPGQPRTHRLVNVFIRTMSAGLYGGVMICFQQHPVQYNVAIGTVLYSIAFISMTPHMSSDSNFRLTLYRIINSG